MIIKKVKISSLLKAGFNPKSRQKNIKELCDSIEAIGLLSPILINKKNEVGDGHRRLAACVKLGWTEVPCVVADGTQADLFREVNFSNRRLSGNEALHAWLSEPSSVSPSIRRGCEECEEAIGRALIRRMANENYSLGLFITLRVIAREADQETPEVISTLVQWCMKRHCIAHVRKAKMYGTSPGMIVAAAKKDKEIRVRHSIAD